MPESLLFAITDASQIGEARRAAAQFAAEHHFDESGIERASIIATELASNIVKHVSAGGQVILQTNGADSFDILALDKGAGIRNIGESLRDGYSTAGSRGEGLGAIQRLANDFEILSAPNSGTVVWTRIAAKPDKAKEKRSFKIGAVSIPHPRELVCGDGFAVKTTESFCQALVVDGLGHGVEAAKASRAAVEVFNKQSEILPPTEMLHLIHQALRPTRGAAVAVVNLDVSKNTVAFGGIGNISGVVIKEGGQQQMVSHAGIAGFEARKIAEFAYVWEKGATLILHSDGLQTRWNLAALPGIRMRQPGLIAGLLYRDYNRATDDTTVLGIKEI